MDLKKWITDYFGHKVYVEKYELLHLIVKGGIQGCRDIGKKEMSCLRIIRN